MARDLARSTPPLDPSALLPPFQTGPRGFNQLGKLEPPGQGTRQTQGKVEDKRRVRPCRWQSGGQAQNSDSIQMSMPPNPGHTAGSWEI